MCVCVGEGVIRIKVRALLSQRGHRTVAFKRCVLAYARCFHQQKGSTLQYPSDIDLIASNICLCSLPMFFDLQHAQNVWTLVLTELYEKLMLSPFPSIFNKKLFSVLHYPFRMSTRLQSLYFKSKSLRFRQADVQFEMLHT